MRRFLVPFSESEASNHTPSLADFTTTTPEFKFSVHTGPIVGTELVQRTEAASALEEKLDKRLILNDFMVAGERYLRSPRPVSAEFLVSVV
jgi:hypothetical protein